MQNAQTELLNVNFKHNLHLPDPIKLDLEDGLSLEHFPVGLDFFDIQGETGWCMTNLHTRHKHFH